MTETLADLYREVFGTPSASERFWMNPQNRPRRPMPREMRPAEERRYDRNPGVAYQAARQLRERGEIEAQQAMQEAHREPRNQFAQAGRGALEMTGYPAIARSGEAYRRGDNEEAAWEGMWGLTGLSGLLAAAPALRGGPRVAGAPAEPMPPMTSIYRGINHEPDPGRVALLGNRWWHTNPAVASSYAPGARGAHVMTGAIDESSMNLAHIRAPPGTMWRAIPVESLPPALRRAFPRSTTHVTSQEVASAAEAAGYDGVTLSGVRDSGFAGAMEGPYPGFGTGDEGRVVVVFNDAAVRSRFPTPPPREIGPNGMPIRPREPFRQSLQGGSDDLAAAAGMRRPSEAPDAGSGSGAQNAIEGFLRGDIASQNIDVNGYRLYLRKGPRRLPEGDWTRWRSLESRPNVLTVAFIERIDGGPGSAGGIRNVLRQVEDAAQRHGYTDVYMENIQNAPLHDLLWRHGGYFKDLAGNQFTPGAPSLYRPLRSQTQLPDGGAATGSRVVDYASLPSDTWFALRPELRQRLAEVRPPITLRRATASELRQLNAVDENKVAGFARRETNPPPIIVQGNRIIDGNHRAAAAVARGQREIDVIDLDRLENSLRELPDRGSTQ